MSNDRTKICFINLDPNLFTELMKQPRPPKTKRSISYPEVTSRLPEHSHPSSSEYSK